VLEVTEGSKFQQLRKDGPAIVHDSVSSALKWATIQHLRFPRFQIAGIAFRLKTFQSVALVGLDAHRGIDRETAAVFLGGHGLRVFWRQQATPPDRSEHSPAHGGL